MDDYFTKIALKSTSRAFNLMDRNNFSRTFGCFDKNYWHFKTKDFPSSTHQMGAEFLARLWNLPHKENPYYKHPRLLEWIKASMLYAYSLQHKDGSFDEWYPNERGWAGPSSYLIHSLVNAYQIIEGELDKELKQKSLECFSKTARFLLKQEEGAILTNHFALFLLSLYDIYQVTSDNGLKSAFESHLHKLNDFISKEGWSVEYDGVDFGYSLATCSFLGRLHKMFPDPFLEQYTKKHFEFLSYFFYPDGSFGGSLGSRETRHLYPYAIAYWGEFFPLVQKIKQHLFNTKAFDRLTPFDQDDHYLFYRLCDYLEADLASSSPNQTEGNDPLPYVLKEDFTRYFEESGIFIKKISDFYIVSNLKKGGCLEAYHIKKKKCLLKNNGWVIWLNKRAITNFHLSQDNKVEVNDESIAVSGASHIFKQKYFRVTTFVIFRVILLLIRNYKQAFYLKRIVRNLLILGKKKSNHKFKRLIQFNGNRILIKDSIACNDAGEIFYGGYFTMRYVPQSNYFDFSDLATRTFVVHPQGGKASIQITQTCHLETGKCDLCVE